MKHVAMPEAKDKVIPVKPPKGRQGEAAFDLWLQRALHDMFDDVAREPVPEGLLRLINEDRKK